MAVLLLQVVDGLEVAIQVLAIVVPGVARIVDVLVRPSIREKHFPSVSLQVCECVENVSACALATIEHNVTKSCAHVRSFTGISDGGNLRP